MITETMDHLEVIKDIMDSTPNAGGIDNIFRNALILTVAELTRLRIWELMSKTTLTSGEKNDRLP